MKLYSTCAACHELMLVVGHPDDTHPGCPDRTDERGRLRAAFLAAVLAGDGPEADALANALDHADQAPASLASAALWYAWRGWPVFPLTPGGKTPLTPRGFRDATTDQGQIQDWWKANPDSNIGCPAGIRWDVIDVDYHNHPEALTAWGAIEGDYVVHGMASTPHGMHIYTMPTGDGNCVAAGGIAGLDYRGRGGYVVVPPSRRPEGRYFWWSPPSPMI